jgi:hypothetical protein
MVPLVDYDCDNIFLCSYADFAADVEIANQTKPEHEKDSYYSAISMDFVQVPV